MVHGVVVPGYCMVVYMPGYCTVTTSGFCGDYSVQYSGDSVSVTVVPRCHLQWCFGVCYSGASVSVTVWLQCLLQWYLRYTSVGYSGTYGYTSVGYCGGHGGGVGYCGDHCVGFGDHCGGFADHCGA